LQRLATYMVTHLTPAVQSPLPAAVSYLLSVPSNECYDSAKDVTATEQFGSVLNSINIQLECRLWYRLCWRGFVFPQSL